ncbi:DUF6575 domain-containing protein [Deinococcus koreensis]|uniref:DUF6575 domain-containing protein n=1 Tax=Deinococcus koreensis TaxID=2054903 RepID=UPI001056E66F|nr:DUF6575 domain-containing protein [Deinococcus koreensis]
MLTFRGANVIPFNTPLGAWDDLTYLEVFEYYDAPLLFSAVDSLGKIYLSVQISDDKKRNVTVWLYSEISYSNYVLLRQGDIDFRRSFSYDDRTPYVLVSIYYETKSCEFSLIPKSDLDTNWLPEEGEFLGEDELEELGDVPLVNKVLLVESNSSILINDKQIENFPVYFDINSNRYYRIYDAIKALKLSNLKNQSSARNFTDDLPHPFISLAFKGGGYSVKFPSIKLWGESADLVTSSYRKAYYASRKDAGHSKPISYPNALGLAASVTFELYPTDQNGLFGFDPKEHSESYTLNNIANILELIQVGDLNTSEENVSFLDLMLQSIEDLSPKENSNYEYVEVRVGAAQDKPVRIFTISQETTELIRSARIALAVRNEQAMIIRLIGVIYEVKFDYQQKQANVWVDIISILEGDVGALRVVELHTTIDDVSEILKYVSERPVEITAVYNVVERSRGRATRMRLISIEEYAPNNSGGSSFSVS